MRLQHRCITQHTITPSPTGSRHLQRGQATVEFGLTIVLLLMVVIGILEFGRIVWLYNTLSNLSREIARYTIAIEHQREASGDLQTPGTILGDVVARYDTGLDTQYLVAGTLTTQNGLPTPSLSTVGIYLSPADACRTQSDTLQVDSVFGPNPSGFSGHQDWFSYAREYQNCQSALRVNPPGTASLTVAIYYPLNADTLIPGFGPLNGLMAVAQTTMLFE